jgi:hypothetical protein
MLVHAVEDVCDFDDSKSLIPISRDHSLYKIDTDHPEMYEELQSLTHLGREIAKVSVRVERKVVKADGKVKTTRADQKDDLLITLRGARSDFKDIPHVQIYQKIVDMGVGSMKRGLTVQTYQNSSTTNGNLYFILRGVKQEMKSKIPNFFSFGNRRMYLNYWGKERKCYFCSQTYVGRHQCEAEEMVRDMENERDQRMQLNGGSFKVKMFGDSTLRHVNQKALACNVDAMPGGTTGNILNAVEIDEEAKDVPNVIIVKGYNETNPRIPKEDFSVMMEQ